MKSRQKLTGFHIVDDIQIEIVYTSIWLKCWLRAKVCLEMKLYSGIGTLFYRLSLCNHNFCAVLPVLKEAVDGIGLYSVSDLSIGQRIQNLFFSHKLSAL